MSTVFWMRSEKRINEFAYIFGAANLAFDGVPSKSARRYLSLNGVGFVEQLAFKKKNSIIIEKFDPFHPRKRIVKKSLQIVDESTDIYEMKDRVVTMSDDINFIRKLFIAGKKVSLYNPNLKENLNMLFLYDFEYLFLDIFVDEKDFFVVWPNKEVTDVSRNANGKILFKDMHPKMAKMIGYDFDSFLESITWLRRYRALGKINKDYNRDAFVPSISAFLSIAYYNYLSLSYLCHNYSVMNVQEKTVQKG